MQKDIKLLDLFSGTGGFALGLKQAGFNIIKHQFSEIDKHAIANYKHNFKNAEYIGSITDVSGSRGQADIITFGSPCQDFSLAGKRKGIKGQRSSLIMEAIRLVSEIQPSVFIWENVKGTFSSNNGADFWAILNAFTNIGNYRLEWQLLNTSWFLPQNRERIYLVGHLAGSSKPGVFPITENDKSFNQTNKTKKTWFQTKYSTALKASGAMRPDDTYIKIPKKAGTLTAGGNSGGLHSDMTVIPIQNPDRKQKQQNGRRIKTANEPSFTISATDTQGVVISTNNNKGFETAKPGDTINLQNPNSKTRRGRIGKNKAQTLDISCSQGVVIGTLRTHKDGKGFRKVKQNISPTIPARAREDGSGQPVIEKDTLIRRLTEIECERLQGFPDNWTKYGFYDNQKKTIAKTQRYKMIGNAVTVNVVQEVASRLHINN